MWENFEEQKSRKTLFSKIKLSFKRIGYLFTFLFKRSRPNLFFTNARDKTPDGRFFDKNADDFLQRLYPDSHIIETYQEGSSRYVYPVSLINPVGLFKKLYYLLHRDKDYTPLLGKINTSLGLSWDNKKINRCISDFKCEKLFYSLLFRFKKTKRIYVTQNGLQKALFCAARAHNIETVEFQHGIIDKGHIAYNYPASITTQSHIYIPDLLLTFSEFWGQDINYPVKRIVAVGNTGFANLDVQDKVFNPQGKVVGFISADVFGLKLADLAKEYATIHKNDLILFKLHPNEFARKKEYTGYFSEYPNIQVITNEQPTEKIVLSCDAIVLIQSTIAYQALQAGIQLFIYKRMTYYRHSHIFHNPNVHLVDNARQIVPGAQFIRKTAEGPVQVFFERFNESAYHLLANFN